MVMQITALKAERLSMLLSDLTTCETLMEDDGSEEIIVCQYNDDDDTPILILPTSTGYSPAVVLAFIREKIVAQIKKEFEIEIGKHYTEENTEDEAEGEGDGDS